MKTHLAAPIHNMKYGELVPQVQELQLLLQYLRAAKIPPSAMALADEGLVRLKTMSELLELAQVRD